MEMLVLEKDYIVIDAEKTPLTIEKYSEDEKKFIGQPHQRLRMSFTVQCNGKLKRSVIDFDMKIFDDQVGPNIVNGWELTHYDPVYAVFNLLRDLGYDVGDEFAVNEIIDKALEVFQEDGEEELPQGVSKKPSIVN